MNTLLTPGVSYSLLSADSYMELAKKPMHTAATELKKEDPNMEVVDRAMEYGTKDLNKANESGKSAMENLLEAKEIARAEKKAEEATKAEKDSAVHTTSNQFSTSTANDIVNNTKKSNDSDDKMISSTDSSKRLSPSEHAKYQRFNVLV